MGLVGAGQLSVHACIPIIIIIMIMIIMTIIMGANIGTSATNTLVYMGQSGDRIVLQRAFAGAMAHDMLNFLTVLVAGRGGHRGDGGRGRAVVLDHERPSPRSPWTAARRATIP